jgi:hypothetical protein
MVMDVSADNGGRTMDMHFQHDDKVMLGNVFKVVAVLFALMIGIAILSNLIG